MKNDQFCRLDFRSCWKPVLVWTAIDNIKKYSSRCIGGNRDGCFHRISTKSKVKVEKNPEEGLNEDEDVQMEKARVKEALSCRSCEEVSRRISLHTEHRQDVHILSMFRSQWWW